MFPITAVFLKRSLVDIALALIVLRSRDAHVAANLSGIHPGWARGATCTWQRVASTFEGYAAVGCGGRRSAGAQRYPSAMSDGYRKLHPSYKSHHRSSAWRFP
ncbi:hypothetical protein D9M68_834250 [compost metagenome]